MKISLITACYNRVGTIEDTFKSILAQTYPDIEYIVVDGASKDNTVDIIKQYEPLFGGRMHWVSESDNGLYDAINKGIEMSTGDVIGIINSDDFFTTNDVLAAVAYEFTNNDIDALYGDVHFVNPQNLNKITRYYSSQIFKIPLFRLGFMPAHPSFYAKKECFDQFGLYDTSYKIAADFDLLVRFLFTNRSKYRYLKKDFVTMRTGGVSTENFNSRMTLNKEIIKACRKYGIYTNIFFLILKYPYKIIEYIKK